MIYINLDPNFKVGYHSSSIYPAYKFHTFKFSGGEMHIKFDAQYFAYFTKPEFTLVHRINSSDNLMELLMANDALRRSYPDAEISAFIPYFPYARQDRVMVKGEPFSLKVFIKLLETANFHRIFTLDPHSEVTPALMDNLRSVSLDYLQQAAADIKTEFGEFILISPDGGALKKIYNEAKEIGYTGTILSASKLRDVKTGKILSTHIDTMGQDLTGKTVWIMDDIIDGGRTFIELAKLLKEEHGVKHVVLSVTHGIVSHGEEELAKWINKIYTTNSVKDTESTLIKRYKI